MPFDTALPQWEEGTRRLADAPPEQRRALERISGLIVIELRRRLGGPFRVDELVDLYDAGTSWVTDVAASAAPDRPELWDVRVVGDAAFARYLREASDYAGGRRLFSR